MTPITFILATLGTYVAGIIVFLALAYVSRGFLELWTVGLNMSGSQDPEDGLFIAAICWFAFLPYAALVLPMYLCWELCNWIVTRSKDPQ